MMFREMFYLLSRSVDNWDQSTGNENCKDIDWGEYDSELVGCWEDGMTGYPYIDAMMRRARGDWLDASSWATCGIMLPHKGATVAELDSWQGCV